MTKTYESPTAVFCEAALSKAADALDGFHGPSEVYVIDEWGDGERELRARSRAGGARLRCDSRPLTRGAHPISRQPSTAIFAVSYLGQ
jgi:hypothetical protein